MTQADRIAIFKRALELLADELRRICDGKPAQHPEYVRVPVRRDTRAA